MKLAEMAAIIAEKTGCNEDRAFIAAFAVKQALRKERREMRK